MKQIQLTNISYRYQKNLEPVLKHVSLAVDAGSTAAVLGPNGAGKSTLLDLLLGWKVPESGELTVFGRRPHEMGRKESGRLMSLVPQDEQMSFSFSVRDYVLFGRSPHLPSMRPPGPEDIMIARTALKRVGIHHLEDRFITRLSGGERQLVKIARSIAQRTELLLLDEPTSDLDPANTHRIITIMRELKRTGVTQVFTTHDPMLASEIASHILLLKEGHLQSWGTPEETLTEERLEDTYQTPFSVFSWQGKRVIIRKHQ